MRRLRRSRLCALAVVACTGHACLVEIADPVPRGETGGAGGTSASGGTANGGNASGGSGGTTSAGGGASCPADMVHAQHPDYPDVSFCIDRTEVTQADYVAFLVAIGGDVANADQPAECAFNAELTRTGAGTVCPTFTVGNDLPVSCVDWCDAYAYCAWAGKRLCGATSDGGPLAFDAPVTSDEWQFACSAGYQQAYPYGDDAQICACFVPEEWQDKMMCDYQDIQNLNYKTEVGTLPGCEGGFPGLFDMQGNAAEWSDRCEAGGTGTGDERCMVRGGSTYGVNGSAYWRCDNLQHSFPRNDPTVDAGIRCCRDADE